MFCLQVLPRLTRTLAVDGSVYVRGTNAHFDSSSVSVDMLDNVDLLYGRHKCSLRSPVTFFR